MSNITEHFTWKEFECHDGTPVPESMRADTTKLCQNLEVLRAAISEHIGHDTSLHVVSGYRSVEYNNKIYEAKGQRPTDSQHSYGRAADITCRDLSPEQVKGMIEYLISIGQMEEGGIGIYAGFVHYDVRGVKARWDMR